MTLHDYFQLSMGVTAALVIALAIFINLSIHRQKGGH